MPFMQSRLTRSAACLLALLVSHAAEAVQAPSSLVTAARGAALEAAATHGVKNPTVTVSQPDPRLRLTACPAPLTATLTGHAQLPGRAVARVSCPQAPGWAVHLPLRVRASGEVLVAARSLPRGHRLQAQDLARHTTELGALNGQYLLEPDAVIGQALRRAVSAGDRLRPALLEAPLLVRRGEPVIIELQGDSFAIRANGKALASGPAGARIAVENPVSKRVVHGTVTAQGRVTVEF